MKKSILMCSLAVLTMVSCQNDEASVQTDNLVNSAIDPTTPKDAQPFILKEKSVKNSTTGALVEAEAARKLLASDEFGTLDTKKWTVDDRDNIEIGDNMDSEIKEWDQKPSRVSVGKDGTKTVLILTTKKISSSKIESARINSDNKTFDKKYGYIEVSMKICNAEATGAQSSFWFMGNNMIDATKEGRNGAEIDVFESSWINDKVRSTVHIDGYGSDHKEAHSPTWIATNSSSDYHLYGLEWTSTSLKFYYDGVLKYTLNNGIQGYDWAPLVNEYLIFSTAPAWGDAAEGFGKRAVGNVTYTYVDYVRWYDKK